MYKSENLWNTKNEIQQLRNEKEHHSFTKVTKDSDDCKGHSSAVTKRVTDEDFTREFVVFEKGKATTQEWNHNR